MKELGHVISWIVWMAMGVAMIWLLSGCERPEIWEGPVAPGWTPMKPELKAEIQRQFLGDWEGDGSDEYKAFQLEKIRLYRRDSLNRLRSYPLTQR